LVDIRANNYTNLSHEQLSAQVTTNAPALTALRAGLTHQTRVPVEYSTNYVDQLMPKLAQFKQLAIALAAEGRLAELENHTNTAAHTYLEIIQFGHECARGGLLMDHLVGIADQNIGLAAFERIRTNLDAAECRETVRKLTALEENRESTAEIMKLESDWSHQISGLNQRIAGMIMARSSDPLKPMRQRFETKYNGTRRQALVLTINLAARAYTLEKGTPPKTINDLIPDYLKAIPKDPTTDANMALGETYSPR
jgi:hypothetical protein